MKKCLLFFFLMPFFLLTKAQIPIYNAIYEYQPSPSGTIYSHNNLDYRYGNQSGTTNNLQAITGLLFPGQTFFYNFFVNGHVKLRRVNTPNNNNNRCLIWMESSGSGSTVRLHPPYTDSMELVLAGRVINRGTDNLFGNQGDGSGNNNNIERVDWIAPAGIKSSSVAQSGFAIFERGEDDQHDPFCIAAILALDGNGAPALYGSPLHILSSHYGNLSSPQIQTSILRKEANEPRLYRTATATQKRGGVLVTLQNLGVANNQTIYGYSLFGNDLPPSATPADLLDYTNPTFFPRNTPSNTGDGGIDLIAITGLFNTSNTNITLPVVVSNLSAVQKQDGAAVNWRLSGTDNCRSLAVERSADGGTWTMVAENLPPHQQQYFDQKLKPGKWFYRLLIIENNGRQERSTTTVVQIPPAEKPSLEVMQRSGRLQLSFTLPQNEATFFTVSDITGRTLARRTIQGRAGANQAEIEVGPMVGPIVLTASTASWRLEKKLLFR